MLTVIAATLNVPTVNTLTLLVCGLNHTVDRRVINQVAKLVAKYVRAKMYTASLYTD